MKGNREYRLEAAVMDPEKSLVEPLRRQEDIEKSHFEKIPRWPIDLSRTIHLSIPILKGLVLILDRATLLYLPIHHRSTIHQ